MPSVRIYQPFKNPMQSGLRKAPGWFLAFEKTAPEIPTVPLGWLGTKDMNQELRLLFPSLVKAIEYAKLRGWTYTVCASAPLKFQPKAYQNNFTCSRIRNESASCHLLFR